VILDTFEIEVEALIAWGVDKVDGTEIGGAIDRCFFLEGAVISISDADLAK
jgi:hypothetical protein